MRRSYTTVDGRVLFLNWQDMAITWGIRDNIDFSSTLPLNTWCVWLQRHARWAGVAGWSAG